MTETRVARSERASRRKLRWETSLAREPANAPRNSAAITSSDTASEARLRCSLLKARH
jgi:hypothetical protein